MSKTGSGRRGWYNRKVNVIVQLYKRPDRRIMHFLCKRRTKRLLGLVTVPRIPPGGLSLKCNLPHVTLGFALWRRAREPHGMRCNLTKPFLLRNGA